MCASECASLVLVGGLHDGCHASMGFLSALLLLLLLLSLLLLLPLQQSRLAKGWQIKAVAVS